MTRGFFKGAYAAFIVGDLTNKDMRTGLEAWKDAIDQQVKFPDSENPIPTFMLCNKADLDYDTD